MAVTLRINKLVFNCAVVLMNPCSEKRVPPAKKHIPSTRSRLESIEPTTAERVIRKVEDELSTSSDCRSIRRSNGLE